MYTFRFRVRQSTGAYSEDVSHPTSLTDVKHQVLRALRHCHRNCFPLSIVREVESGGEYWIDTHRGRVAAHWNTPLRRDRSHYCLIRRSKEKAPDHADCRTFGSSVCAVLIAEVRSEAAAECSPRVCELS